MDRYLEIAALHERLAAEFRAMAAPAEPARVPAAAELDPPGFTEFWAAYPVKKGRRTARLAFLRARGRGVGVDTMLAAIARQAASSRSWARGYIPLPATWLGQDRYLDEDEPKSGTPTGAEALADFMREAK